MMSIDEGDRQMIVLALACLSLDRPGWNYTLSRIAEESFNARKMYESFKECNSATGRHPTFDTSVPQASRVNKILEEIKQYVK